MITDSQGRHLSEGNRSFQKLMSITDEVCEKHHLSHWEWDMSRQGLSWKEKLKYAIDQVIKVSEDFDDFLAKCKDFGVLVEYDPDHKIDLKYMLAEQKERNPRARFTRSRTLDWFYFLELMMSTDGDERDRAECIYIQLMTLNNDRLSGEWKYFSESSETITGKTIRYNNKAGRAFSLPCKRYYLSIHPT